MRPPVLWASANGAARQNAIIRTVANKMPRRPIECSCRKRASTFMTSPLAPKSFFENQFFEVAVPLKPYYNPVNLEKAGTRVKQKEFIQSIGGAPARADTAHQRSGPPRGDFLLGVARLGGPGAGVTAAYAEPLPPVHRIRRASAAARHFPSPGPWTQSRRYRPCPQAPGCCFCSGEEFTASRTTFPPLANPARSLAGASGSRHWCLRGLSQRSRARPDAFLDCHAAPHRALLPHQHSFALRNRRR